MDFPILRELALIVFGATAALVPARALRLPPMLGYLLAGLVLGPLTGAVAVGESVEIVSEVGIALLLFLVGLELSLERIRDIGRTAVLAGAAQMVLTAALGFGLATLLGFPAPQAAFLAAAVTFSSTVVVVRMLDHAGELAATHGRIAVGILLVQDVAVALVLALLTGIEGTRQPGPAAVAGALGRALAGTVLLGALAVLAARRLLPRLFAWLARSPETLFLWSLSWCFALVLFAHAIHISVELGAFIAGVALAQLPESAKLAGRVEPLADFFLAVFFVALGIRLDPGAAAEHAGAAIALSLFVILGKPLILMAVLPRFGYGERTSFRAGLSLGQISEFAFIMAALALAAGLIEPGVLSLVGVVGLVTIGVSAVLIGAAGPVYRAAAGAGLLRPFRAAADPPPPAGDAPAGHVIVVGMNTLGRRLVTELRGRGHDVLALDVDAAKLAGLPCRTLLADADQPDVLERAGLRRAALLVSTLQIEDANKLLAHRARAAGVPASIHAFDSSLVPELEAIGVAHLMVSKHEGIRQLAAELRRNGVMD
jgi:Kef-type K+ transport system membrane component KefB